MSFGMHLCPFNSYTHSPLVKLFKYFFLVHSIVLSYLHSFDTGFYVLQQTYMIFYYLTPNLFRLEIFLQEYLVGSLYNKALQTSSIFYYILTFEWKFSWINKF